MAAAREHGDTIALQLWLDRSTSEATCAADVSLSLSRALTQVQGPFALVYWHRASLSLCFARDRLGRRSLLLRRTPLLDGEDCTIEIGSVAAVNPAQYSPEGEVADAAGTREDDEQSSAVELADADSHLSALADTRGLDDMEHRVRSSGLWDPESSVWHEIPPWGVYSIAPDGSISTVRWASHTDAAFEAAASTTAVPLAEDAALTPAACMSIPEPPVSTDDEGGSRIAASSQLALTAALAEAVRVRVQALDRTPEPIERISDDRIDVLTADDAAVLLAPSRVAVLFSGGLDSAVLARLCDDALPAEEAVDLLSVCFDSPKFASPDRIAARASLGDLQRACPSRMWRLVEINQTAADVVAQRRHLATLLQPRATVMDLSLAAPLWFAAQGCGSLQLPSGRSVCVRSRAAVVLSGQAADEMLGGYIRYRVAFAVGGAGPRAFDATLARVGSVLAWDDWSDWTARWLALRTEMCADQSRLWARNLGRDDRIVSDQGRELRAPFLDDGVRRVAAGCSLDELVWPGAPRGLGEKCLLRAVASSLGLVYAAALPKRAMQFGTRLAKHLNRMQGGWRVTGRDPL